jgi:hypothetical protein
MQVIPGITRCPEHDLLIHKGTTTCSLCGYFWDVTPELIEAFKKHEAHGPAMVLTIGLAFFDPMEHCFECMEKSDE